MSKHAIRAITFSLVPVFFITSLLLMLSRAYSASALRESVPNAPIAFTETARLKLMTDGVYLNSAVIDTNNGFAYFGAQDYMIKIMRVRLTDFTNSGSIVSGTGGYLFDLKSAVIDAANGFAYFGVNSAPGRVLKVRLSDFTLVGTLVLNDGENGLVSAVIDPAKDFAYFGTAISPAPAKVIKVRLSTLTRVDAITIDTGDGYLRAAAIDTLNGFAYFAAGKIIKIRLADFTPVATLPIDGFSTNAVIDQGNGYLYLGLYSVPGTPARILKVRLSDLTLVSTLTLNPGESDVTAATIDSMSGFAYFGTDPGIIVKVRLSDLARMGALALRSSECCISTAVIDPMNAYAYFGTRSGNVAKIDLAALDFTKAANALAANAGDTLTYTLTIANDGPITATNLMLTDTVPVSATFISVSPGSPTCITSSGQVICNLGSLTVGTSTQVTIQAMVNVSTTAALINTATLTANEPRFNTPITSTATTFVNPLRTYLPLISR